MNFKNILIKIIKDHVSISSSKGANNALKESFIKQRKHMGISSGFIILLCPQRGYRIQPSDLSLGIL